MSLEILSKNNRIAKNTIFLYVRMFIVLVLTLYISRVVLNLLGIIDYGVYNVVGGFVAMFSFLNISMSNGVQRFYNYDIGKNNGKNIKSIYTNSVYIQIILCFLIILLTETLGVLYINYIMVIPVDRLIAANWVFQLSIFSFIFTIIQVPYSAAILAYEKINFYAIVSIIDVCLKLIAVILLDFLNSSDSLIFYSSLMFLISIIDFLLYFSYTKKKFSFLLFQNNIDKPLFKNMLHFNIWNIFGSFAYMIKDQGLNILLNSFFGPVINASRGIAFQISSALQSFSSNVFTAFRPHLMQSYSAGNFNRTTNLMFTMTKVTFYLLIMISIPVVLEVRYILRIWLGNNIPDQTEIFTILIIINMLITNFNPPTSQVVHATGKMKKYQLVTSIVLTSILPLSWISLKFGANASSVYIVSLIVAIINQFICLVILKQLFVYSLRQYFKEVILRCIIVSIMTLPIPLLIHYYLNESFAKLVIITLTTILMTTISCYLYGFNELEKNSLKNLIFKFKIYNNT